MLKSPEKSKAVESVNMTTGENCQSNTVDDSFTDKSEVEDTEKPPNPSTSTEVVYETDEKLEKDKTETKAGLESVKARHETYNGCKDKESQENEDIQRKQVEPETARVIESDIEASETTFANSMTVEIEDFDMELKRHPSPLCHNDSGLGTSLNSPVGSSTEASPQHICHDVTSSVASESNDAVFIETLTLCSEINEAWCNSNDCVNSTDGKNGNINNSAKSQECVCSHELMEDAVNETEKETGATGPLNGKQDDGATSNARSIDQANYGSSGGVDVVNNVTDECSMVSDENFERDSVILESAEIGGNIKQAVLFENPVGGTGEGLKHSDVQMELESHSEPGSGNSKDLKDAVTNKNIHLEMCSPTSSSSLTSFQQYYINKRNLNSTSLQAIESQVKKSHMPKKVFNPFPVKHVNQNRAKTGIKLGLYKQSTLEQFEKTLKSSTVWGK